jgi:hypothetical protein
MPGELEVLVCFSMLYHKHSTSHKKENIIQKLGSINDIVLQPAMDVIKEEPDLDEGTSQLSALKEEPLVDIKYEDNYNSISPAIFVSPEMVSCVLISNQTHLQPCGASVKILRSFWPTIHMKQCKNL